MRMSRGMGGFVAVRIDAAQTASQQFLCFGLS